MKKIVILISGRGSNMQSICQAAQRDQWRQRYGAEVVAVISNKADATGLVWAQQQNIACAVVAHEDYASRAEFDAALAKVVDGYQPSLLLLAGFMRILTAEFIQHFNGRMLNIHPSLLPAFKGTNTYQRALDAGCKFTGASVHEVTEELDAGAIIDQVVVPILADDDAQTLAERVLSQEHLLYPRAVVSKLQQL